MATGSRVRVGKNIAGVAVDELMEGQALLAKARRWRKAADVYEAQGIECIRKGTGCSELASRQIDGMTREMAAVA